jgi:hypothetical protein
MVLYWFLGIQDDGDAGVDEDDDDDDDDDAEPVSEDRCIVKQRKARELHGEDMSGSQLSVIVYVFVGEEFSVGQMKRYLAGLCFFFSARPHLHSRQERLDPLARVGNLCNLCIHLWAS